MQLLFFSMLTFLLSTPSTTKLTVNIGNIDMVGQGRIYVYLWDQDNGFPSKPENAKYKGVIESFGASTTYQFSEIPYGTYAISIHQDVNKNAEVEANFIGIPKEPIGAYNLNRMGKPSFKKCSLVLNQSVQEVEISMIND